MPQEQRQSPSLPDPATGQPVAPTFALDDVARARLVAQRLAGPGSGTSVEAVRWLTAIQAQDFASALTSVGLRTGARLRAEVISEIDAGEIVRSWPMRGTLHLTAAKDLPWMLHLLAPRVVKASAARRSKLGLDEPQLQRARELTTAALSKRPTPASIDSARDLGKGRAQPRRRARHPHPALPRHDRHRRPRPHRRSW